MNKKIIKHLMILPLMICALFALVACETEATPAVVIGFKITDGASEYQESIDAFEIGKDFYTAIKVKIVTDKKASTNYFVVVEVPKTNNVIVDTIGGIVADKADEDIVNEKTILTFTIKGSKEAIEQKILFKGTPFAEGDAKISVTIYNEEMEKIQGGAFFRTIAFKYELQ